MLCCVVQGCSALEAQDSLVGRCRIELAAFQNSDLIRLLDLVDSTLTNLVEHTLGLPASLTANSEF